MLPQTLLLMENFLLEILKDSNTIIIPGLGALTVTNKDKGEYMFMPFLKHDDGTLKKFIASKLSCDEGEAKEKIDRFVAEVNSKLDQGATFEIAGFGVFKKDNSGDISFDGLSNQEVQVPIQVNVDDSSASKEPEVQLAEIKKEDLEETEKKEGEIVIEETVQVEAVVEEQPVQELVSEVKEEKIEEIPDEDAIETNVDEVQTILVESVSETEPEEIISQADSLKEVESVSSVTTDYSEQQQWEDDLDLPPINAKVERPKKPIIEKVKKDKKRRSPLFYVLILLLVLLVGGATTVGVFYNQIKTALFSEDKRDTTKLAEEKQFEFAAEPTETETIAETESETSEPIETSPEEKQPEVVKEAKPTPPVVTPSETINGDFMLIVGSFQNEGNATRFSEKMRSEGNDSQVIGPKNGFYLVTIGTYNSEAEAKKGLNEKITKYPKVWLYKKA